MNLVKMGGGGRQGLSRILESFKIGEPPGNFLLNVLTPLDFQPCISTTQGSKNDLMRLPCGVAAEEDDDDAEKDDAQVDLLSLSTSGPESLEQVGFAGQYRIKSIKTGLTDKYWILLVKLEKHVDAKTKTCFLVPGLWWSSSDR